jgi:hypothetical protein
VDGVMNVIKIGYLEAHRELAPGNLLMQRVLEQCDSDPAIRKVSLGTDPPWSHSWRAQAHKLYDFHVFNTTWRSRAVQILRRGVTMRDHLRDLSNGRPDAELA